MAMHTTDVYVGTMIRERRRAAGLSQGDLARACGITFQQIQKYERGTNRVSMSRMEEIARVLACAPGEFFPGPSPATASYLSAILAKPGGEQLLALLAGASKAEIAIATAVLETGRTLGPREKALVG